MADQAIGVGAITPDERREAAEILRTLANDAQADYDTSGDSARLGRAARLRHLADNIEETFIVDTSGETDARRAADQPDDNAPDIPPALTADEWAARVAIRGDNGDFYLALEGATIGDEARILRGDLDPRPSYRVTLSPRDFEKTYVGGPEGLATLIALANAALHDEDPRKFTREHVDLLRYVAGLLDAFLTKPVRDMSVTIYPQDALANSERYSQLLEFADVIESYLPPDPSIDRGPFKNETQTNNV